MIRVAILTASDKASRGERQDRSAQVIRELVAGVGGEVVAYDVVPDVREVLAEKIVQYTDQEQLDLVLTTGGTGLGPRDVTPEATLDVVERLIPGIASSNSCPVITFFSCP